MRFRHKQFDVAVIGSGLGGLVAATLLAREDRSVLLLKDEPGRVSFEREGYRFLPFSNFSENRVRAALWQTISSLINDSEGPGQIGIQTQGWRKVIDFQVVLPGSRIDLYRDRSLLQGEWKREFGGELVQIKEFYSELDRIKQVLQRVKGKETINPLFPLRAGSRLRGWFLPDFLPRKKLKKRLSAFSPEFREFIRLQVISLGSLFSEAFPLSLTPYLLLPDEEEMWKEVDLSALNKSLLEAFVRNGGRIEEGWGVERIERKRNEGWVLSSAGEGRALRSRFLLLNAPLNRFVGLFGKRGKTLMKWEQRVRPRYTLFPLFLGIRESAVPVGLRDLCVSVLDIEKPYEGGNLLFLSLNRKGNETQAPEGKRALTAMGLLPFGETDKASLHELEAGMMKHLCQLIPFLEGHIEFVERKWIDNPAGCEDSSLFLYETDRSFDWRKGAVPVCWSSHLYFTGREGFPFLGLEGEMLSGLMVGREVLKKVIE